MILIEAIAITFFLATTDYDFLPTEWEVGAEGVTWSDVKDKVADLTEVFPTIPLDWFVNQASSVGKMQKEVERGQAQRPSIVLIMQTLRREKNILTFTSRTDGS